MDSRGALRAAVVAVAAGCVSMLGCGDERSGVPPGNVDRVSTELAYGECGGYCRRITELAADLSGHYRELPHSVDPMYPPKERSFVVTEREWASISDLASSATQQAWESTYGCPDCADQGAWRLTIHASAGETRATTLDGHPDKNPEPLQRLIDAVSALHAESR